MHIIHITPELSHCAKIGGLADVVYGLCKQLQREGHTIDIIMPKYDCMLYEELQNITIIHENVYSAYLEDLHILLIDDQNGHFQRHVIYGCQDDSKRFLHFCKQAFNYLLSLRKPPDILHLHDWTTAIIASLCKKQVNNPYKTVLTIHNLEYQGICDPKLLLDIGLSPSSSPANILAEGIRSADHITTVSPHYLQEIQTPLGGCGLHLLLQEHKHKLSGILNGIDEHFWNPAIDPLIYQTYSTPEGKKENRKHLCSLLGLKEKKCPLVISITRIATQKAPELIFYALRKTLALSGQFVLLGAHPSPEYQPILDDLEIEYKNHPDVAIRLHSNERLAHLLFASADMIIIPSLFEPCGLTQMIALKYGTIPLVRATGGLADTVFDIDTAPIPKEKRNGFTFDFADTGGVDWVLERAFTYWKEETWDQLIHQGLQYNWSFEKPTKEYTSVYKKIL